MNRFSVIDALTLSLGLACVLALSSVVSGQSRPTSTPIGVDEIIRVLTHHKHWTLYRDRADRVTDLARPRLGPRTSDRSASMTLEFMRVGPRLIGHAENDDLQHVECEFDVEVADDGVAFPGCTGPTKSLTYDPGDRDYPFKGRTDGMLWWLAPSK